MTTYEIWIKNDPALNGRDCQCQIVSRATLESRGDWSASPQTTDLELCELNLKLFRRDNPTIADHYEIRDAAHGEAIERALSDLDAAADFWRKVKADSVDGHDTTANGAFHDANEWLRNSALALAAARGA